jgi:hypothetical protein
MPVALERKLKAKVADKKMSKERKDAYVYGTLRKTGWKPEREKKMNDTSETINFVELPVKPGESLERLKGIVAGGRNPFIRNEVSQRHFLRTKLYNVTKPWDRKPYYSGYGGSRIFEQSGMGPKLFMNSDKLVRLSEIDRKVDSLIQFDRKSLLDTGEDVAAGAALTAGGYGAYKTHKAIQGAGGYREAGQQLKIGYGIGKAGGAEVPIGEAWKGLRKGFKKAPGASIGSALGILRSKLHLESKEKPIQFDASILGPWQGSKGHESKIDQLEFPAGLSPAAALQFPLPVLMKYLNQRNLLQQQFSWKAERLVQLSAKLDEINA